MRRVAALLLLLLLTLSAAAGPHPRVPQTFWGQEERTLTCPQLTEQIEWLGAIAEVARAAGRASGPCALGASECFAQSDVFVSARNLQAHLERVRRAQCLDV